MELWYQQHSYLNSQPAVEAVKATMSQAAAAGYTGVVLWDTGLNMLNQSWWDPAYIRQVIAYANSLGLKIMPSVFPYGYSNDILNSDPNLAEAQHVSGTRLQVNSTATALSVLNSFPGFENPGFESGATGWFSYQDGGVQVDATVAHTGSASAVISNPPSNARLFQTFKVTPWRQYHFRVWAKTQAFTNYFSVAVYIMDSKDWNAQRLNSPLPVAYTQDWTAYDFTINSGPSTSLNILMGEWGGSKGNLWIDDVLLEETALVYAIRRNGTPLSIYDPDNPSTVYNEGTDFNPVSDPEVRPGGFTDHYHTPPAVTLPSGTRLQPGQVVAMDFYAVEPIYGGQVGMCLTDPGVQSYLQSDLNALAALFPSGTPYMLGYDEMRHMNSCASCRAKNMTAGQLLAWNVQQSTAMFQSASPGSELYFWGDMFDPNFNAHGDYYLVEGDLAGSWLGLPAEATIMNWNLGNLATSLKYFAGMTPQQTNPFRQVIAGFYDPADNDGARAATAEMQQAAGIPGVVGIMYTTWNDNYSQLATFAAAARKGWAAYVAGFERSANHGVIAGIVRDPGNNAIAGAQVSVVSSGGLKTAATTLYGSFLLSNIAPGNYTVTVTAPGYSTANATATVTAGDAANLEFNLNPTTFSPVRINAGGPAFTDNSGTVWSADTGFLDGATYATSANIANTTTATLYRSERYAEGSTLEYRFVVPNGSYNVKLKFAEIFFTAPGQRVFNIVINGATVASRFDPFAAAGGQYIAHDLAFPVAVANNIIDVRFVPVVQNPKISGIEITAAATQNTTRRLRRFTGTPGNMR